MTPNNKAIDLIRKFADINDFSESAILENAKGRAFILVEEMINELSNLPAIPWNVNRKVFWEEVRRRLDSINELPEDTFTLI